MRPGSPDAPDSARRLLPAQAAVRRAVFCSSSASRDKPAHLHAQLGCRAQQRIHFFHLDPKGLQLLVVASVRTRAG